MRFLGGAAAHRPSLGGVFDEGDEGRRMAVNFGWAMVRDWVRRPWVIPVHLFGIMGIVCYFVGAMLELVGNGMTLVVDRWLGEEWGGKG